MSKFIRFTNCTICLFVFALIVFIISLFLWIGFHPVFEAFLRSYLVLSHEQSGRLSETTWLWYRVDKTKTEILEYFYTIQYLRKEKEDNKLKHRLMLVEKCSKFRSFQSILSKPPVHNVMNFYLYNVTNTDRIIFYGEKPQVIEVGPFAIVESEAKNDYEFRDGDTKIWYKNYKTYIYNESLSCPVCKYDAIVNIANLPMIGAIGELQDPRYRVFKGYAIDLKNLFTIQKLLSLVLMLFGEYPFVYTKFGDVMFDGYNDALLSAAHSDLLKALDAFCNCSIIPVPVPTMKKLAMFFEYNNTNDDEYVIDTGKEDINNYGKIISWAGTNMLPEEWWTTEQARMINGSDTGSFQPPGLNKSSINRFFQSFLCRSFYMTYKGESTVHGIPTYEFQTPVETFDTTLPENFGFRYANREKINYYPEWPDCRNYTQPNETCPLPYYINCTFPEYLCHKCCNKSFIDDTYILPPGMYYTACYPGKYEASPFYLMYSAPHFAFSPPEVAQSIVGQHPKIPDHVPFVYNHEKTSSAISKIDFRFQVNIPMYKSDVAIIATNFPNKILPVIWVQAEAFLQDWAYDTLHLGFVLVPKIVNYGKIFTLLLSIVIGALAVMWGRRSVKKTYGVNSDRENLIERNVAQNNNNSNEHCEEQQP